MRLAPASRRRRSEQGAANTGPMLDHEGGAVVQNIVVGDDAFLGKIVDRLSAAEAAQPPGWLLRRAMTRNKRRMTGLLVGKASRWPGQREVAKERRAGTAYAVPAQMPLFGGDGIGGFAVLRWRFGCLSFG